MDRCARCEDAPPRPRTGSRGPKPIYCEPCFTTVRRDHAKGWHERARAGRQTSQCVICDAEIPTHRSANAKTCSRDCQDKRVRRYLASWNETNRSRRAATERKRRYDITDDEYRRRLVEQNHECIICRTSTPPLVVDHDHQSGVVRGLICSNCNVALGMLADNPLLFERAAAYLRTSGP